MARCLRRRARLGCPSPERRLSMNGLVLGCLPLLVGTAVVAQTPGTPWIATTEPITILSANDGWTHGRLTEDADLTRDVDNLTPDSVTVVHLGPDHPPIIRTVYDTVPNSIVGPPYVAMTGDGRYGFVPSRGSFTEGGYDVFEESNLISVIDLASEDVFVVQKLEVPILTNMLAMHPDGKHLLVPTAPGFRVYAMEGSRLALVGMNSSEVTLLHGAYDISPQGDRIVAFGRGPGDSQDHRGVHVFSYQDGQIQHLAEVGVEAGLPLLVPEAWMLRFSPDGTRVLIPNAAGVGTKGTLDEVLSVDMTRDPPMVTEVIPQVCDGIESLAYHPSGQFVVLSCLEEIPAGAAGLPKAPVAYSRLVVVDLTTRPTRRLYGVDVRGVPEGIEFTPDGTQLFVQLTAAHQLTVFDVEGSLLKKHPFSIRLGHGPASMALGRRYMAR